MQAYSVSVIIPTFNRRHTIKRAIRSVLAQTRLPDEIIVVDDGSTDGTGKSLRDAFPDVNVITQAQRGVSAARNTGIRRAGSEWIALLDSDDEWLPTKLQRQFEFLQSHPQLKICHTEEIWIRRGRRVNQMNKHRKSGGWIFRQCLPLCAMSPSSIVFHKSVIDQVGLFDENLPACEDYDMWLRVCSRHPVGYVEEPQIIKYGGHDDQLSRRYWGMDRFRIRALEKLLAGNALNESDRAAAARTLNEKIDIYVAGAAKRGRLEDVRRYESIKKKYPVAPR